MKLLISFSGECAMKKTISLFFGLLLLPTGLYAGESSLIFNDSSSFQTALSLKLGHAMGEMEKPNKGGVEKGALCESDADCSSSEKCKGNTCVNVCDPNPCSSGYCLDEGNHSYSCVACLNDDHCSADKKCSGNACVDVCTGNNCTQQSKLCSSNGNHGYLCYGCTSDAACANDEFCDTTTKTCRTLCPDSCEGNLLCEITGTHKAKCFCESDENCSEGQICDLETKQCISACQYTPESCAEEIGGTAEDWYIKETPEGCECATDKKYVILAGEHPNINYSAEIYNRIKAVKDFSNIKFGTLGGYIEKESNLSQTGNAWVGCDSTGCALVSGNAQVYDNALVTGGGRKSSYDSYGGSTYVRGNAKIYGNAKVLNGSTVSGGKIYGNAVLNGTTIYPGESYVGSYPASVNGDTTQVYGNAKIYAGGRVGGGKVYEDAVIAGGKGRYDHETSGSSTYGIVHGKAKVLGAARVSGNAEIYENAKLFESVQVEGNAKIYGNAQVGGNVHIRNDARLYGNVVIKPRSVNGVLYIRGTAALGGTASVPEPTFSGNHIICKGTYTKGVVQWQADYGSEHKLCPAF